MKTQTLFKSIFVTAFIALLLLMVPCDAAGNPSALVGRWVGVSGSDKGNVMELLSDGTGIIAGTNKKGYYNSLAITWKTENNRFYVTARLVALAYNYKLQGSLLTFTDDKGEISEYAKCNKDCKTVAKEYAEAKEAEAEAKAEKAAVALKAELASKVKKGSFTDPRDGKTYKTVTIGTQTWMAENLNYNAEDSKCYENQESNCQKYGRLYDWETAKSACPKGWHLPSKDEWRVLVDLVGGNRVAGNMLKASSGWNNYYGESGNGVDAIGFSALPGGSGSSGGDRYVGEYGSWWSATAYDASYFAYNRIKSYFYDTDVLRFSIYNGYNLFSVRCLQD